MRLTQRETDALIRAWREQSTQPLSPASNARLTAIVCELQAHDPEAMRKWLIHGGDLGAHFGAVSRAVEAKAKANTRSQARVLATDMADGDALDHTIAAPFFIDELLDDTPANTPGPAPRSTLRATSRAPAKQPAAEPAPLTVDLDPQGAAPWQAEDAPLAGERIRYREWRKVAAVCFAVATLATQTLLMVALISAAFAWQTGTALASDWFLPLGIACAAVVLAWVCHRTFARFQSINDGTGLPVTAPRLIKLTLIPIVVGVSLALLSELGPPLLAGTGLTGTHLTLAILAVGLLCNTAYCHTVPRLRSNRGR